MIYQQSHIIAGEKNRDLPWVFVKNPLEKTPGEKKPNKQTKIRGKMVIYPLKKSRRNKNNQTKMGVSKNRGVSPKMDGL